MDLDFELKILMIELSLALTQTIITEHGEVVETRKKVDSLDNIDIEIYPKEHPPPHFHVILNEDNYSFRLIDGSVLTGKPNSKILKKINYYYAKNRERLIKVWNHLRPCHCPVGPISLE